MIPQWKIYPRSQGHSTVYLQNAVNDPSISVGEYTVYDDFVHDPRDFQRNNVLYHYPINHERLVIGKFCSIACGAKFLFNSANHALGSLSTYTFPIFFEEWGLDVERIPEAWDNHGDIVVGNDVWIGYEAVILAGVTIGTCPPTPSWAASPPDPSGGASRRGTSPASRPCAGGTGPRSGSPPASTPSSPGTWTVWNGRHFLTKLAAAWEPHAAAGYIFDTIMMILLNFPGIIAFLSALWYHVNADLVDINEFIILFMSKLYRSELSYEPVPPKLEAGPQPPHRTP